MNNILFNGYVKITFIVGVLLMLAGCGGYEIPMHKNKTSAFIHKKNVKSGSYRIRLDYPIVYRYENRIVILIYREPRSLFVSEYSGFEISLDGKPTVDTYRISSEFLENEDKMPSKYYDAKRTFYKKRKWPTFWTLIYDPKYPKIYFRWKPTVTYTIKGYKYDEGILEVMLLHKGASSQERELFNYLLQKFKASKIVLSEEERSLRRASNAYANYVLGAFSSQLSGALKTPSSNEQKGIQIKYQGYNKSSEHYVYNLKYNGSYDGQIVYYPKNGGYTIMTVGVKHGQSVNGNFADGRLYTPQCGHTHADNIDNAIKKAVNCSYKSRY